MRLMLLTDPAYHISRTLQERNAHLMRFQSRRPYSTLMLVDLIPDSIYTSRGFAIAPRRKCVSDAPSNPVSVIVDAGARQGRLAHNWTYIGYDEVNYAYVPEG